MPVTITNLQVSGPLHVPLASGSTLRLSPGQTSGPVPDVDVQENDQVERLVGMGLVEVTPAEATEEDGQGRQRKGRGRAAGTTKADGDPGADDATPDQ